MSFTYYCVLQRGQGWEPGLGPDLYFPRGPLSHMLTFRDLQPTQALCLYSYPVAQYTFIYPARRQV